MIKWRIAIILVGLLLFSPIIYLNYWGIQMSAWSSKATQQAEAVAEAREKGEPLPEVSLPAMPQSPLGWLQERREMRRMESDGFNGERVVQVSYRVPFKAFLAPGEEPPEPVFRQVYATARAPQLSMIYCPEILATLATGCAVHRTEAKYLAEGDEIDVKVTLAYLPDYQIGERPRGAKPLTVSVNLIADVDPQPKPTFQSAARRFYLTKVERLCAEIRKEYGTCVVSSLTLSEAVRVERTESGKTMLYANARIAVLAPEGQVDRQALDDRVQELAKSDL